MPKNRMYVRDLENKKKREIQPIWRGAGCILIVILPLISYTISTIVIDNKKISTWIIIPKEIIVPKFSDPLILVKLLYTIIFIFILFFIIVAIVFFVNKVFGPSRRGPFDPNR